MQSLPSKLAFTVFAEKPLTGGSKIARILKIQDGVYLPLPMSNYPLEFRSPIAYFKILVTTQTSKFQQGLKQIEPAQ